MLNIEFYEKTMSEQNIEIVERKGKGHPDSICDGVVEAIAIELAKLYKQNYGAVLHFNIDKALLAAGTVEKRFGGGRVTKPMQLYIGDRATFFYAGKKFDVNSIVKNSVKKWFTKNLPNLDPAKDVDVKSVLAEGSEELTDIFSKKKNILVANDTSAAVGYYPLTSTENMVLKLEQYLNSEIFKRHNPDTGEDIKIMAFRNRNELNLTVAMPLMAKMIKSEKQYFNRKQEIMSEIMKFISGFNDFERIKISLNALDKAGKGLNGVYLSLLGTSAEDADSGEVGRGNKVNGVIPFTRPIGTEAAAGKNPVSHVGKIYNVFSHYLAKEIYENVEGIKEVYVFLLSEIGRQIDKPKLICVKVASKKEASESLIKSKIRKIVKESFSNIHNFCEDLAMGKFSVY